MQAPAKPTDTHDRPPEFDLLLVAHLPAIHRQARHLSRHGSDEIVAEASIAALRCWQGFRPDLASFYTWLMLYVRSAARDYRVRTQRHWDNEVHSAAERTTPAGQLAAVELAEVLAAAGTRYGRAAVLMATGHTIKEIGVIEGIHPVYAGTCARRGRAELRKFAGLPANDNRRAG